MSKVNTTYIFKMCSKGSPDKTTISPTVEKPIEKDMAKPPIILKPTIILLMLFLFSCNGRYTTDKPAYSGHGDSVLFDGYLYLKDTVKITGERYQGNAAVQPCNGNRRG